MTELKQIKIVSGCKALDLPKGAVLQVVSAEAMGPDYSHQALVVVQYGTRRVSLWARHPNRLQDPTFNLNNGNPLKRITVKAA